LATPDGELSYGQLDQWAAARADQLRRRGITRGCRLAMPARSLPQQIVDFWALLRCGATAVLLSPRWPPAAIDEAVSLVAARRFDGPLALDRRAGGAADETSPLRPLAQIAASPATIIFSSGSGGTPKAIAHSLSAHLASAYGANRNLPLQVSDAWLLSLPLFHVSGLGILFRCTLAGAAIVVPPSDLTLGEQLRQSRVTHVSLVPTQLIRLLDESAAPPATLRVALLGGGPLSVDVIVRARRAGWPLATTYGLSEMASQVTATTATADEEELSTAGRVLSGRELAIAGDGQIMVRGMPLFDGYVRGNAIVPATNEVGWFPTGDVGHLDSQGRLIVHGRRDHMFISGGENVYPEEIERALLGVPGVHQAVVVPVADRQFGHRPVAFVEGPQQTILEWRKVLADRLPAYKIPIRFLPWPTQAGLKANRRELQQLVERSEAGPSAVNP
jgi:O-succinylbenzoic acid--CoA ligase